MSNYCKICIMCLMMIFVWGCDKDNNEEDGGCTKKVDQQTASNIQLSVLQMVTGTYSAVGNSSTYPYYISSDGSVEVTGEYTTYPYFFKFVFAFKNYKGSSFTIKKGSVTYIDKVDDDTSIHYWIYENGYFNLTYQNEDYEMWWDFSSQNQAGSLSYEGSFRVCGSTYEYDGNY